MHRMRSHPPLETAADTTKSFLGCVRGWGGGGGGGGEEPGPEQEGGWGGRGDDNERRLQKKDNSRGGPNLLSCSSARKVDCSHDRCEGART